MNLFSHLPFWFPNETSSESLQNRSESFIFFRFIGCVGGTSSRCSTPLGELELKTGSCVIIVDSWCYVEEVLQSNIGGLIKFVCRWVHRLDPISQATSPPECRVLRSSAKFARFHDSIVGPNSLPNSPYCMWNMGLSEKVHISTFLCKRCVNYLWMWKLSTMYMDVDGSINTCFIFSDWRMSFLLIAPLTVCLCR